MTGSDIGSGCGDTSFELLSLTRAWRLGVTEIAFLPTFFKLLVFWGTFFEVEGKRLVAVRGFGLLTGVRELAPSFCK